MKTSQIFCACAGLVLLSSAGLSTGTYAQSAKLGKEVFLRKSEPACAVCHALKDAGASGEIGPDLDELKPDQETVRRAVKNGVGTMPAFGDTLSEAEIAAVARYVAGAAGGAGRR